MTILMRSVRDSGGIEPTSESTAQARRRISPGGTPGVTLQLAERVYVVVRAVPPGRVTTYGTIAELIGRPRNARLVGWAMRRCPDGVPAHRVVNASGDLSGGWAFGHPSVQRGLLEAEGVRFVGEARCDLARHVWPRADEPAPFDSEPPDTAPAPEAWAPRQVCPNGAVS